MAYKLLGMAVWKGLKLFLHRRYGATYVPRSLLAGGVVAIVVGIALLAAKRNGDD